MNIDTLRLIYFSPTQTTKKVLEGIAAGFGPETVHHFDLTLPDAASLDYSTIKDGLTIIGAPVYSGRVAPEAARRITRFKAQGTPAVLVVLYGNREFEDALRELKDLAENAGFKPIAGGAFIGEHSFATENHPIACDRPDARDIQKCTEFGSLLKDKVTSADSMESIPAPDFPGNYPYREPKIHKDVSPITLEDQCTLCQTCATVCPTAAIKVEDHVYTDTDACIVCCACVKNCPTGARVMNDPKIQAIVEWLWKNYCERREPEFFI